MQAMRTSVVQPALSSLVKDRKRKNLLELAGEMEFPPEFDHKPLRALRMPAGATER